LLTGSGAGVVATVTAVQVDAFEGPVKTDDLEAEVAVEGLWASLVEETTDLGRRRNIEILLSLDDGCAIVC
jgi:hypothetical protein